MAAFKAVLLLIPFLAVAYGYPSKAACARAIVVDSTIMGATVVLKDDREVVSVGGESCGGTLLTNVEYPVVLTIPSGAQYMTEVAGVAADWISNYEADDGDCPTRSTSAGDKVTFTEAGDAVLRMIGATAYGTNVGVSEDCTFTITENTCVGETIYTEKDGALCYTEKEGFHTYEDCAAACAGDGGNIVCPGDYDSYHAFMVHFNKEDKGDMWLANEDATRRSAHGGRTECVSTNNWGNNDWENCALSTHGGKNCTENDQRRCVCTDSADACAATLTDIAVPDDFDMSNCILPQCWVNKDGETVCYKEPKGLFTYEACANECKGDSSRVVCLGDYDDYQEFMEKFNKDDIEDIWLANLPFADRRSAHGGRTECVSTNNWGNNDWENCALSTHGGMKCTEEHELRCICDVRSEEDCTSTEDDIEVPDDFDDSGCQINTGGDPSDWCTGVNLAECLGELIATCDDVDKAIVSVFDCSVSLGCCGADGKYQEAVDQLKVLKPGLATCDFKECKECQIDRMMCGGALLKTMSWAGEQPTCEELSEFEAGYRSCFQDSGCCADWVSITGEKQMQHYSNDPTCKLAYATTCGVEADNKVTMQVKMAGESVASFDQEKQLKFRTAAAKVAETTIDMVSLKVKAARRANHGNGILVDVTIMAADATKAEAIAAAVTEEKLNTALTAEGLSAATVEVAPAVVEKKDAEDASPPLLPSLALSLLLALLSTIY